MASVEAVAGAPVERASRINRALASGSQHMDRMAMLYVALAAALWAADAYFRPALTKQLSSAQIVLVEDALIALCFVPAVVRRRHELARLAVRDWLALCVVALGAQALATVLFTQSLGYAFPAHAAPDLSVENEVYFLYLLQPLFGIALARLVLGERRKPYFWPLAAVGAAGVYLIVFPQDPGAPLASFQHGQVVAALYVLGAVALWASGTVFGRYALAHVSFVSTAAMRFTLALPALLVLDLVLRGGAAFSGYSLGQAPSFLGISLIPGLLAMLLYYRALSRVPASLATIAELAYPATLFLVFSLPKPVGLGAPLQSLQVAGALLLVAAVTSLNLVRHRGVIQPRRERRLAPAD